MIIQIYEIQTPQEAEGVVALGVDRVGSVLLDETRWKVPAIRATIDRVRELGASSSLIPLFVRAASVCRALEYYRPDIVHFCDALPRTSTASQTLAARIGVQKKVRERFPDMRIMRSIPIRQFEPGGAESDAAIRLAREFEPLTDIFLTDTLLGNDPSNASGDQPVDGFIGITGRPCDWSAARRLVDVSRIPVILAGGLGPGNVFDGILRVRPAGVDSCTGTNRVNAAGHPIRFTKDPARVKQFVDEARRAVKALAAES